MIDIAKMQCPQFPHGSPEIPGVQELRDRSIDDVNRYKVAVGENLLADVASLNTGKREMKTTSCHGMISMYNRWT